jgi:hypothetical protein
MVLKRALKLALAAVVMAASFTPAAPAFAYRLSGNGCGGNGSECKVYCDNGQLAGIMYFNGSVWSDGVRWDKSADVVARAICVAQGTACT